MRKQLCLYIFLFCSLVVGAQKDSLLGKTDSSHELPGLINYKLKGKLIMGTAGIYSNKLVGATTANGDIFSQDNLTAASNRFPLNSYVKITNPQNKKTVVVQITDRMSSGAVKKGLLAELSTASARNLAFNKKFEYKINMQLVIVTNLLSILNNKINSNNGADNKDTVIAKDSLGSQITYQKTGEIVRGIASFYSTNLDGSKTSTGETFRHKKLTAASNNLPLNTWVLVTNLKNKKTVIVRINDRMHPRMKKKGRVIDLSKTAAAALDFISDGLTRVSLEVITLNGPLKTDEVINIADSLPRLHQALAAQADSSQPSTTDTSRTDAIPTKPVEITGMASIYNENLEGEKTASGEIFRNSKLIAGSTRFKLNTLVKITNIKNNKSVVIRINDRMRKSAKAKERVAELSKALAKKLDFPKTGLAKVKIEAVPEGVLE